MPGPRRNLMRDEMLTRAAEVFGQRGFSQARIQDVAEALEMSRSSLYYYFKNKSEILAALIAEDADNQARFLTTIAADAPGSATDQLRAALRATISHRLIGGARMRVLDQLVADMPPELRHTFERGRRDVLDLYIRIIRDGVRTGEFRSVDPGVAALAVIGIASWTSWWYSPEGRKSAEELTDILTDIAVAGLLADDRGSLRSTGRACIIGEIQAQLDRLERMP